MPGGRQILRGALLLHHRDDGPVSAMRRGIVAPELRRVEPGRHASIEKERITAAKAITEKPSKLVEAHPTLADDEMYLGWARHSDAVPRFAIG